MTTVVAVLGYLSVSWVIELVMVSMQLHMLERMVASTASCRAIISWTLAVQTGAEV